MLILFIFKLKFEINNTEFWWNKGIWLLTAILFVPFFALLSNSSAIFSASYGFQCMLSRNKSDMEYENKGMEELLHQQQDQMRKAFVLWLGVAIILLFTLAMFLYDVYTIIERAHRRNFIAALLEVFPG